MKKINFKKIFLGMFLTASLTTLSISLCLAYGEKTCNMSGPYTGICLENTEHTFSCVVSSNPYDNCSGS